MADCLVSIIMPVYNTEKFVASAIEDILNQTFSDFELIIVDDCSNDGSGKICDLFAGLDIRIKVFHMHENKGASYARNFALDIAAGKYVSFLDSDDRFDCDLLYKAVDSLKKSPADAVVFGVEEFQFGKKGRLKRKKKICPEEIILKNEQEVRNYAAELEKAGLYGYPCNKLYDMDTIKKSGARFPDIKFNEDIIFNIDFFEQVKKCNLLNFAPYKYMKRFESSTTSRFIGTYYEDIMLKIEKLYLQFTEWNIMDGKAGGIVAAEYVRYIFSSLMRNCDKRAHMNLHKRKAFLRKIFESDIYCTIISYFEKIDSGILRIMAKCLEIKSQFCCLLIAHIIYLVKKYLPAIYYRQ